MLVSNIHFLLFCFCNTCRYSHCIDISISHRLLPNKPWTDKNGNHHPPAPPTIIAKFVRREKKEEFYSGRWKLKDHTSADIETLETVVGHNIFISESLTRQRKKLFNAALKLKKELRFHNIYTNNGQIYLKKSIGTRYIHITSEADLARLRKSTADAPYG